jgi:nucleolar protein 12
VDEILGLEEARLKFAKRKLRVQRCKVLPAPSSKTTPTRLSMSGSTRNAPKPPRPSSSSTTIPQVPKGDPTLGDRLARLPKDERKEVKASDAGRVARRLAKKKARIALGNQGSKVSGRDRDRTRTRRDKGGSVRKEKSVSKRNVKK